jgi:hypothetical protein
MVASPQRPSAPKKHLLSDTSHSLWTVLWEGDHGLQHGGSGHRSAQECSFLMPTFLGVITCRAMVHPFACAFQKKNCSTSMVAIGMCARLLSMAHMFEKVLHFSRLHQSNIPSTSRKLMGDAWHIGSTPMPDRSTHRWKQLHKLYLSIGVRAEGKHLCKPCYLCNITSSPICFSRGKITL